MSAANGELARSRDGTAISYETIGVGEGLLVLGGAWRTSRDYLPFAHALADSFAVTSSTAEAEGAAVRKARPTRSSENWTT